MFDLTAAGCSLLCVVFGHVIEVRGEITVSPDLHSPHGVSLLQPVTGTPWV